MFCEETFDCGLTTWGTVIWGVICIRIASHSASKVLNLQSPQVACFVMHYPTLQHDVLAHDHLCFVHSYREAGPSWIPTTARYQALRTSRRQSAFAPYHLRSFKASGEFSEDNGTDSLCCGLMWGRWLWITVALLPRSRNGFPMGLVLSCRNSGDGQCNKLGIEQMRALELE